MASFYFVHCEHMIDWCLVIITSAMIASKKAGESGPQSIQLIIVPPINHFAHYMHLARYAIMLNVLDLNADYNLWYLPYLRSSSIPETICIDGCRWPYHRANFKLCWWNSSGLWPPFLPSKSRYLSTTVTVIPWMHVQLAISDYWIVQNGLGTYNSLIVLLLCMYM